MKTNTEDSDLSPHLPPEALSTSDLARLPKVLKMLDIGRTAWLDLVRSGKAPQPVKIGRATLWVEAEIRAFIADRIRASRELTK